MTHGNDNFSNENDFLLNKAKDLLKKDSGTCTTCGKPSDSHAHPIMVSVMRAFVEVLRESK